MKTRLTIHALKSNQDLPQVKKENNEDFAEFINSASTAASNKKKKWRRKRKNCSQVQLLVEEYNKNSVWTKEQVVWLAEKTGLSEAQVYKWGWDYSKKLRKQAQQFNIQELLCTELIAPSKIDLEMLEIQKRYKEEYSLLNAIVPMQLFF